MGGRVISKLSGTLFVLEMLVEQFVPGGEARFGFFIKTKNKSMHVSFDQVQLQNMFLSLSVTHYDKDEGIIKNLTQFYLLPISVPVGNYSSN